MNFFNAAKKTGADLTYNRGSTNATQNIFEAALFVFLSVYAPIGLCIALVIGFFASTAYNMCLSDQPEKATATA